MTDPGRMRLVFRLGGVGFSLPVQDLIEIREEVADALDRSAADPAAQVLGALSHRGGSIPVRDLGRRLELPAPFPEEAPVLLVLTGEDGCWGVLVDRVEGIFPTSEFDTRPVPPLLVRQESLPYTHLDLWRGEPLVHCEAGVLQRCWGRP